MSNLLELAGRIEDGLAENHEIVFALRLLPPCDKRSFEDHMQKHDYETAWIAHRSFWHNDNVPDYLTSLDAAKKLHTVVLFDEDYSLGVSDGECSASIDTEYSSFPAGGDTLAAAWVAAILKAKSAASGYRSHYRYPPSAEISRCSMEGCNRNAIGEIERMPLCATHSQPSVGERDSE